MTSPTSSRKKDHVDLCVNERVTFRTKTSGFERISFIHNALPEMDFEDVKTEITFLQKRVAMPLMVSCMTGGYAEAERINRELGTTTIVITHNAAIARMADRVICLSDGQVQRIETNTCKVSPAELSW